MPPLIGQGGATAPSCPLWIHHCVHVYLKVHVHCNTKVKTLPSTSGGHINTSVFRMLSYLHINTRQDAHRLQNLERGNAALRLKLNKIIREFNSLSIFMSSWKAVKTIAHRSSFSEDHRSVLTNLRAEKLAHMLLTRQGGGQHAKQKMNTRHRVLIAFTKCFINLFYRCYIDRLRLNGAFIFFNQTMLNFSSSFWLSSLDHRSHDRHYHEMISYVHLHAHCI